VLAVLDDCWNRIGVRGDASCPKLEGHVHCRNCPTYSAAALSLLDREPAAERLRDATLLAAQRKSAVEEQLESVVVFRLDTEWLGLPTAGFREIATERPIHSLPHRKSPLVLGIANVRGELLVCASLERLLGLERNPPPVGGKRRSPPKRLLVLKHEGLSLASPVDEAWGVHRFRARELKAVPATLGKAGATFTKSVLPWQKKSVGVLDLELVFYKLNRSLE
jgi:chemotaxis-related protein WspD